jgi:hypothetical protein
MIHVPLVSGMDSSGFFFCSREKYCHNGGIAFAHHPAAAEAGPEPAGASLRGVRRERATVPFPHLERIPGERCVDVGHRLHPRRVGRKGQRVDPADEREALP